MQRVIPKSYESVLGRCRVEDEEKSYQQRVVDDLVDVTEDILSIKSKHIQTPKDVLLKAPTGSGKTVITGGYIDMLFTNYDKVVVLWLSESPSLTNQSLGKLRGIFGHSTTFYGEDSNYEFRNKTVVGINWEKIKNVKAREDTETTLSIDTIVRRAKEEGMYVVTVIDEAHAHADSKLSREFLEVVNSDVELYITATPKRDYSVNLEVNILDVQQAGFIKQGIVINDLKSSYDGEYREEFGINNLTEYFLRQSLDKRDELEERVKEYAEAEGKKPYVPLLVIQLPNNSKEVMDLVEKYLGRQGYNRDKGNLAVYMSDDYTDELDAIGKDEEVKVLLFKQAISKGWDCPRASVITLLRDPKQQHFVIQTIGRILRMPYLEVYPSKFDGLNYGYVYIEETENQVLREVMQNIQSEDLPITLYKREGLETDIEQLPKQVWENVSPDREPSKRMQKLLNLAKGKHSLEGMFDYLGEDLTEEVYRKKLAQGRMSTEDVVGKEEIDLSEQDLDGVSLDLTVNDMVYEFNKECRKNRLNLDDVWVIIEELLYEVYGEGITDKEFYQRLMVNKEEIMSDMLRLNSELEKGIQERYEKVFKDWEIPVKWVVPIDAELQDSRLAEKTPYNEVWTKKNNLEKAFIDYLVENEDVMMWYKNGDRGSQYFSIAYELSGKHPHFYPDFLIETDDTLYVLETKGDLDGEENKQKELSMKDYRSMYMLEGKQKRVILGYVKEVNGTFYIYTGDNFDVQRNDLDGWEVLKFR